MKLFQKVFLILSLAFIVLFVPTLVNAGTVTLGGMDLDGYCRSQNQGGTTLANNTWSCQSGAPINMTGACQWQYADKNAIAQQDTPGNPYTWTCYRMDTQTTPSPTSNMTPVPTPSLKPTSFATPTQSMTITPSPSATQTLLGGMDLDGYCRSRNLPGAVTANGIWTCGSGGQAINMTSACQWQYISTAVAQQDTPGNPYTWSCYTSGNATVTVTPTATPVPSQMNTSPTPTAAISPTATPSGLIIRRSVYSLSPDELRRLVNAINTLRANGTYRDFMNRHLQAMMTLTPDNDPSGRNVAHKGPAFLAWHRAFIYEFEEQLRTVDPTVTLPYWPFEQETGAPRVFTSAYFGSDGTPSQNDQVTDGPFASWGIIRRIARDPDTQQTSLPTTTDVNTVLQNTIYDSAPYDNQSGGFDMSMEGWIGTNRSPWSMHNLVHGYIGGDMGTMDAVNDPIFFLVHANLDRLWYQWEQTHGTTNYQPISGGPTGHNLNDTMRFLLRTPTPSDVLDIQQDMGYTYN